MNKLAKFLDDLDAKGERYVFAFIGGALSLLAILCAIFAIVMS